MKQTFEKFSVIISFLFLVTGTGYVQAQPFYFGADLSYVNQMEDCGADYLRDGVSEDPFRIFADEGTNLVRVRLWVDPSWWQEPLDQPEGVKPYYSDLEDVKKTIGRAQAEGMEVMLGFHYSDFWADPGRQLIPRRWLDVAENPEALADSVYHYTKDVLTELDSLGLMPEFVKVGNENNPGVMIHIPEEDSFETAGTVSSADDWQHHADIFNAGISAVREVGETASINPKITLHWSNLDGLEWWYSNLISHGVTDFDVMGFSYYYAWHEGSIAELESAVEKMVEEFPDYDVMAVETGYLWSDQYGGIINEADPEYLPVIPEKQLEYMVDYSRAVMRAGGTGVVFWEPAWVDTPCRTPWGTGSSHTHVAFFDPETTNFMENGAGKWPNSRFYENSHDPKVTFIVDMSGVDVSDEGVFVTGDFTGDDDWELVQMADEGEGIYSYFTYLPEGSEGAYYFLNGEDWDARETVPDACADRWDTDREYIVGDSVMVFDYKWASCDPAYATTEVNVTFRVDMADSGVDFSGGVYITGDLTDWDIMQMNSDGEDIFSYDLEMSSGDEGAYYYLTTDTWDNYMDYRETVPEECADWYGSDRGYVIPDEDVEFAYKWGTCQEIQLETNLAERTEKPGDFELFQNYPNPFNPTTQISFRIPVSAAVSLRLFDMTGREVKEITTGLKSGGYHHIELDAGNLSSGIYLYQLQAGEQTQTRKLTLIK